LNRCYTCGETKTWIDKRGHENWRLNHDLSNNMLCVNCYNRYYIRPKWSKINNAKWGPITSGRKIGSNGHSFYFSWLKRNRKCSKCQTIKGYFDFHHEKGFFIIFPWFGIIELCKSCHDKEKWRLGEFNIIPWNKGRTNVYSAETLEKFRRNNGKGNIDKRFSIETRTKMSKAKIGNKNGCKNKIAPTK
jgi:hypothetical protein